MWTPTSDTRREIGLITHLYMYHSVDLTLLRTQLMLHASVSECVGGRVYTLLKQMLQKNFRGSVLPETGES